jgi:tetratricopeptide (TPR) repeat protein/DNA-binding SARP family transcriptional activator
VVEFRLLGPVEVWAAGARLEMGPPQQRLVLAALAVDVGKPVFQGTLMDRVWGEHIPNKPSESLQAHVSKIRRALASALPPGEEPPVRRDRQSRGYLLEVDPEDVDLHRFRRLTVAARDRPDDERVRLLRAALELWRGKPLADFSGQWAVRMRTSWEGERLQATIAWARDEVRLGQPHEVLGPLRELVADHPLEERPVAILMRALTAAGLKAEALDCYEAAQSRLDAELSSKPGADLRETYYAIARGDILDQGSAPSSAPRLVPAQLPPDAPGFTGRTDELGELNRLLGRVGDQPPAAGICAVVGTAGVGKTALAVRWAHTARDAFPDGQLYIDLRGYDPEQPILPASALSRFLTDLGVPGRDIPLDTEHRAARYRTEMDGRRMIVVLDNAASVDQIRPLLPGTPSCAVIVTSRDDLAGLIALHGGRRLDLGLLPLSDAIALLREVIGIRVQANPEAAATLAIQCARLPLALRVAGELATARPGTPLVDLVRELADQARRLRRLDPGGDPRAAVRIVFSWSYRHLDADAARAFRLVGLHPGADMDLSAIAALTKRTQDDAARLLDTLVRAHLLQRADTGRYGMHDLLRAYARSLAETEDSEATRRAAITALFDYYLAAAATAMNALSPAQPRHQLSMHPVGSLSTPPLTDPAAALAWLDAERANLVAVSAHAVTHSWPGHTIRLANVLFRYLDSGGHFVHALSIHTDAIQAADQMDDRAAEAHALANVGLVHWRQGRYEQGAAHYRSALSLFRQTGDRSGEARTLTKLGLVNWRQGRYPRAAERHQQALKLYREIDNPIGQANALSNLGIVHWRQGRYHEAAEQHQQALSLYRENKHRFGEANALANLGVVHLRQDRNDQAARDLQQALVIFRETGNRIGEAYALTNLGVVHLRQGDFERATEETQQAIALFRYTGNHDGEAEALNRIGEIRQATEHHGQAISEHAAALTLAVKTGDRYQQACALSGLAAARHMAGQDNQARQNLRHALQMYTDLGVPDAEDVRRRLDAIHQ